MVTLVLEVLAAPIAIAAGWLATVLESYLGPIGFTHERISGAIVVAVTFTVGAVITYLSEMTFIRQATVWLQKQQKQQLAKKAQEQVNPPGDL